MNYFPKHPKIFTEVKYQKYQQEYQDYFHKLLVNDFSKFYNFSKTINDSVIYKYYNFLYYNDAIKNIIYCLEYCNIFIYTKTLEIFDMINIHCNLDSQLKKYELIGYFLSNKCINGEVKVYYDSIPNMYNLYNIKTLKINKMILY